MRRPLALLLALAALAGLSTACQSPQHDRDALSAAIDRSASAARGLLYEDASRGRLTQGRAVIDDDLRYRVDVTVQGQPAASTVVVRDARALRVQDQGLLPGLNAQALAVPGQTAPPAHISVPAALTAGSWVLDPQGASALRPVVASQYVPGADPVFDTLNVLQYVRDSMSTAWAVVKFNPESATYRPRYDHLPRPAPGVTRYDLVTPNLPPGAGAKSAAGQVIGTPYFREMSVYVTDGLVVAVREIVSVRNRLADPKSNLYSNLHALGVYLPPTASLDERSQALLAALDKRLAIFHQPPIRERTMDAVLSFGAQPQVELPAGATNASLAGIDDHGQVLYENS